MRPEELDHGLARGWARAQGLVADRPAQASQLGDDGPHRRALQHLPVPGREDRGGHGLVPALRVALGEDQLRLRIARHQLAPEVDTGGVGGRAVGSEDLLPFHGLAVADPVPQRPLLGMGEDLGHVVARAEAQLLQRGLERERTRARHAHADHLQRQGGLPGFQGRTLAQVRRRAREPPARSRSADALA